VPVTFPQADPDPIGDFPRAAASAVAALLVLGTALRVALGFESFWLDEAWSHAIATRAESVFEVFTGFRHDNNHLLNTLYLYAVDAWVGDGHWIFFRLPALVCGGLSLWVLWRIGLAWGRTEALFVLALAAASFPMASASAQARGYAGAILCGLLYVIVSRALAPDSAAEETRGRETSRLVALWGLAIAGLLSHPTFAYTLAGVVALDTVRDLSGSSGLARAARGLLFRHGVPVLAVVLLYLGHYAEIEVGGGPVYDRFVTIRQAVAQTMALPRRGPLTWAATAAAAVLLAQAAAVLIRARDRRVVFFGVAMILTPAVGIALSDPRVFYARYLLALFPWFYLVVAIGLADAWRRGRAGRLIAAVVLGSLVLSNLWHGATVLAEGRDDYAKTLAYLDAHTAGPVIEVGSDHDFRNHTLLRFYAPRIESGRSIAYVRRGEWPGRGPEWLLRHDWQAGHAPEALYEPTPGLRYRLAITYEHGPGDGFQWFVYRRESPD
jgi:hypothetical protein